MTAAPTLREIVQPVLGANARTRVESRVPLYTSEFAADPHSAYRAMRQLYGSLVPVWLAPGVPATLVIGYRTGLQILNDPDHFPADPQAWERDIPDECTAKAMLMRRNNAVRTAGEEHARYRKAIVEALAPLDLFAVERAVDRAAERLINAFCEAGTADLRAQYAAPLTFYVMCDLLGLPPAEAEQAWADMAAILDGVAEAGPRFAASLYGVVTAKRAALETSGGAVGDDVVSRLITHPAGLADFEVVEQLALLLGPGTEPTCNTITNTVLLMMTDPRFAGGMLDGSLSIRDAIDEVLYTDTPLMNFCMSYPRQPQLVEGVWLPAHQPVVISMAACNNDPNILPADGERTGNRAHLSWGAGPHQCPAQALAEIIIHRAIGQLLDVAPDIELADPGTVRWRPGAFHRALADLQVVFPAVPSVQLAMPPQLTHNR
ncbi:cytochrome P450 [Nocardia fusca]|uniref:cytochrome P450 n=1 Tax=Nocardia fusca TaxID=941183 RepID=UPI0037BA44CF